MFAGRWWRSEMATVPLKALLRFVWELVPFYRFQGETVSIGLVPHQNWTIPEPNCSSGFSDEANLPFSIFNHTPFRGHWHNFWVRCLDVRNHDCRRQKAFYEVALYRFRALVYHTPNFQKFTFQQRKLTQLQRIRAWCGSEEATYTWTVQDCFSERRDWALQRKLCSSNCLSHQRWPGKFRGEARLLLCECFLQACVTL